MSELEVPREHIEKIYKEIANDISGREAGLRATLPVDATAGLDNHLNSVVEDWETNRKSLRTLPTCNAYKRELGRPVEEPVLQTLTGFDALINVLDDVIDSRNLNTDTRIKLTVNAAFSSVLIAENLPTENREDISDLLRGYFTALFQIPLVEGQLFNDMVNSTGELERRTAATHIYSYRARDIDIFARTPAIVTELDTGSEQRIHRDLRTFRAHQLLFKDIRDVPRDLSDDDPTPVIQLLRNNQYIENTVEAIEQIYTEFEYTEQGDQQYGSLLKHLEGRPNDIQSLLRDVEDTVSQYSN